MKRTKVFKEIDELITSYCDGCFLHLHFKKEFSKSYAHKFCIGECTIGQKLQEKGKTLINDQK
ncbi:zinc-finger domain-containing protein [Bacillus sp. FJAT-49732]|uniref:Zinc-finger domain-containing protein n=1 Tax=Lederbergia citrisecunda TaxID=2833583 RepID=A0A942YML3_9BACI|nr:zinc-finger domain-containing protein [Lederbergia citrisecunda]MBS4199446.1 zinc-finger domain-containing protein [Lederbergia citrisecunda]